MDIILLGMQGSGKGTQASKLARKHNFKLIETGSLLRREVYKETELGQKIKDTIEAGQLVSDEIIVKIVMEEIKGLSEDQRMIIDGTPRNIEQKEMVDRQMEEMGRELRVVQIIIPEEEAVKRISGRRMCPKCGRIYAYTYTSDKCIADNAELYTRKDDQSVEAIRTRMSLAKEKTFPVIEKYKQEGKLIEVNGLQPVKDVYDELITKLTEASVI